MTTTTDNPSGITPCGWRIVIKPEEVEKVSKGGIILFAPSQEVKEALAQIYGQVVAIGPECFKTSSAPWCKPGDRVIFGKYAGLIFPGADGQKYRVVNDTDIVAIVPNFTSDQAKEAA